MDDAITKEYGPYLTELSHRGLLPSTWLCSIFVAGSLVRGWGNDTSDLDVYVITAEPWAGTPSSLASVGVQPSVIPSYAVWMGKRRIDIQYWLDDQVDQLMKKVSWHNFDNSQNSTHLLTGPELDLLERIGYGQAFAGEGWLEKRRREVAQSAVFAFAAARNLNLTDFFVEDAIGQLQAGDVYSAVLSARSALGYAVDALMSSLGEIGTSEKWRARRMVSVKQEVLTFDEYWSLETMQAYDPTHPEEWVDAVLAMCQRICHEVSI